MSSLPTRTDISGSPSKATAQAAFTALFDFIAQRLATGTSGAGTATNAELQTARDSLGLADYGGTNLLINGGFSVNQRVYVSGAAVGAGLYGHDRWKMAASGDTYTFSTTANVTTVTIPATKVLRQVVEGLNLITGTYTLSWSGTAQGKIGAGSLSASGVTGSVVGGTDTTIEFGPGTVSNVRFEYGPIATAYVRRPYTLELALCQRYFAKTYDMAVAPGSVSANGAIETICQVTAQTNTETWSLPVTMRATPSITMYSPSSGSVNVWSTNTDTPTASISSAGQSSVSVRASSALTAARAYNIHLTVNAEL